MRAVLDKDPVIVAALARLSSCLGPDAFVLADHWDSDPCAVGVASPRDGGVLVYITCHGERPTVSGTNWSYRHRTTMTSRIR